MDVLRLYPEYQQQFANDIQHDLTFNLREGYECQDSDIGPSLALPSINEDDENQPETEETSPVHITPPSNFRSSFHGSSPRHAKLLMPRGRSNIATIRERVERQRSVNSSHSSDVNTSLEGLNLEQYKPIEKITEFTYPNKTGPHSMERLDSQVSTLHQDVAQLSAEVRNAIHALQEISTTMASQMDLTLHKYPPARSIPNILSSSTATNHHPIPPPQEEYHLCRSSSHPPEMWREIQEQKSCTSPASTHSTRRDTSTQTDEPKQQQIDFVVIEQFIKLNQELVLGMLGVSEGRNKEIKPKTEANDVNLSSPSFNADALKRFHQTISPQSSMATNSSSGSSFKHKTNSSTSSPRTNSTSSATTGSMSNLLQGSETVVPQAGTSATRRKDYERLKGKDTRPFANHRFSAGDADKLEKGLVRSHHQPSTRSLKDNK